MKNKPLNSRRLLGSVLISLLLLALLAFLIRDIQFSKVWNNIQPKWIAIGLFFYLVSLFFRTRRNIVILNRPNLKMNDVFIVQCLHSFLNNTLPFGFGELSLVYLYKRLLSVPVSKGSATLIAARTIDFGSFALYLPLFLGFYWNNIPQYLRGPILTIITALVLATIFLGVLIFRRKTFMALAEAILGRMPPGSHNFVRRILEFVRNIAVSFDEISNPILLASALIFSFLMWVSLLLMHYSILNGCGANLGIWKSTVFFNLIWPASLLPVKGLGNLGSFEAAWTIALTLVGIERATALAIALSGHAIIYAFISFGAVFGISRLGLRGMASLLKNLSSKEELT